MGYFLSHRLPWQAFGRGPTLPPSRDFGDGDSGGPPGASRRAAITGIVVAFAAITMMFAALTSAMVVRRGLSGDWITTPLPFILWPNTGVLLLSSGVLELARRALRNGDRAGFNRYWTGATALGVLFLAGQFLAFEDLRARGIYIASNPSSSFFYVLTVWHAVHLLGGVIALGYIDVQAWRLRLGPAKRTAVDVSTLYWHFLDGLWVYVFLLFRIWG